MSGALDTGRPNSSSGRAVDVAVTIAPNTSSASGSASAPIITRASLLTMHVTIAMTSSSRPPASDPREPASNSAEQLMR